MNSEKLFYAIGNISDKYIEEASPQSRHKNRPLLKSFISLTTAAAIICLVMLGDILFAPNNTFDIRTYAIEQQTEGSSFLREIDLINNIETWGGYSDGKDFYLNVGLKCEGENIANVEFSIEDGFFAKWNPNNIGINEPMLYGREKDAFVAMYNEFENVGSKVILSNEELSDKWMLFLGKENSDLNNHPKKMIVHILVNFNNEKTQEQTIIIDLSEIDELLLSDNNDSNLPDLQGANIIDELGSVDNSEKKVPPQKQKPNVVHINGETVDLTTNPNAELNEIWHTPQYDNVANLRSVFLDDGTMYILPEWGGHIYNKVRNATIMPDGSEQWNTPTFEEAYAAIDYDTAPDTIKEVILESRYKILADPDWLKSDVTIINEPNGNVLRVPKQKLDVSKFELEKVNDFAAKYGLPHVQTQLLDN